MRSLAEWLVLPLFLLPILAVLGVGLLARERHRSSLDTYRRDGRALAARWLAPPSGPAAWIPQHVRRGLGEGRPGRGPAGWRVPFELDGTVGEVLLGAHGLGGGLWRVTPTYPVGLSAAALADDDIRLQIEIGARPATISGVDEGTRALAALLAADGPDLASLRVAPLPAATKRFLLAGWRRAAPENERLLDADRLLAALATLQAAQPHAGLDLPLGAHRFGDVLVLAGEGAWPLLIVPDEHLLPALRVTAHAEAGPPVRLVFAVPAEASPSGDALWSGRLEAPLAGTFSFVTDGGGWWEAPLVRRWRGPVLALAVLLLALPAALLVSVRRRRLREEARVRFLNEIAHDLRTPLTSLRLHADLLSRGHGDEAKRARHLATVTREAARLSTLLANLLDLARLETGRRRIEVVSTDVREVVEGAFLDFAAGHPARAADLALEGEPGVLVRADVAGLARALANLLDNAGKFTPPGTPIRVAWKKEGADVSIRVADEGPGIPASERGRVFRRYVRGRSAKDGAVPGTGLGLALVVELLASMGGSVELVDGAKGATFDVRLPGGGDA